MASLKASEYISKLLADMEANQAANGIYASRVQNLYIDVKEFDAKGDGTTDDSTVLQSLITAIGSFNATINFSNETDQVQIDNYLFDTGGDFYIAEDLTFPSNIEIRFSAGAKLIVASGKTVTINGVVNTEYKLTDIFTGDGTVTYNGENRIDYIERTLGRPIVNTSTDVSPAVRSTLYRVDASSGPVTIYLPDVVEDNTDEFFIQLVDNGNHVIVTTVGGTQLIDGATTQEIPTTNSNFWIKANGVDGYDIVLDNRIYMRNVSVTSNLDLSNGYESGAVYDCIPPTDTEITITIKDAVASNSGQYCKFILGANNGGSVRVRTVTGQTIGLVTEPTIVTPYKGFEVMNTGSVYLISQDSRPTAVNATLIFYGTDVAADVGGYSRAVTTTTDPDYDPVTPADITTAAITGLNQYLGGFITDAGALQGVVSETTVQAIGNIRKVSGVANFTMYTQVYVRDSVGTETLWTTINTTPEISSSTFEQFTGSGLVTEKNVLPTDRIVIKVYGNKVGLGTDPVAQIRIMGTQPSMFLIPVASSSIAHDSIAGVNLAGDGIPYGHISDQAQTIYGEKTFNSFPITPSSAPTSDYEIANKKYVDDNTGALENIGGKNLLINGNFDVWQRGTTFSTSGFNADRWRQLTSGTVVSTKKDYTGAEPFTSKSWIELVYTTSVLEIQKIEDAGQYLKNKKSTLSFWAKGDAATTHNVTLRNDTKTTTYQSATYDVTTNWQKFEITFNAFSGWDAGDVATVYVANTTDSGTLEIAQVKFEVGDTATPFIAKTYAEELRDCQRYYCKSFAYDEVPQNGSAAQTFYGDTDYVAGNVSNGGFTNQLKHKFPVEMRIDPTVTLYGDSSGAILQIDLATGTQTWETTLLNGRSSKYGIGVYRTVGANLSLQYHFTADAEL